MKILKYIKFVFCLTIIVSLVVPSYAALSASDGSVFITERELDNALVDFNNRLTTFESGINTRIDSKVTSYLDANGIWSGQSIDGLHKQIVYVTQTPDRTNCYDGARNAWRDHTKIFKSHEFITRKSGLVVINYNMKAERPAGVNIIHISYKGGSTGRDGTFYLFNDILDVNANIRKYFNIFSYAVGATLNSDEDTARCLISEFGGTISFFSGKDDKYLFRVGDYWDSAANAAAQETAGIPYPWYFEFPSAEVY